MARSVLVTVSIAVCICMMAGYLLIPASVHFRLFHDEESFCRVMSEEVDPGMSLDEVRDLLGTAEVVAERDRQQLVRSITDSVAQRSNSYPDGVTPSDQFLEYGLGGFGVYLQFREGRLVNFSRSEYEALLSQIE